MLPLLCVACWLARWENTNNRPGVGKSVMSEDDGRKMTVDSVKSGRSILYIRYFLLAGSPQKA